MKAVVTTDPVKFRNLVFPLLDAEPVRNIVILGLVEGRALGEVVDARPGAFVSVHHDDDSVAGAAVALPGRGVFLGDLSCELAPDVADVLAEVMPDAARVEAAPDAALAFAERWRTLLGRQFTQTVAKRLHRLGRLVPHSAPGAARPARSKDHELCLRWWEAFFVDVGESPRPGVEEYLSGEIERGRIWIWETLGEPVSLAGYAPTVRGVNRVGPVYTPDEYRGRGYASAVTAHVSQLLLDRGCQVCLYTDLANPTSNRIYAAIGYQPIADLARIEFT